MELPPEEMSRTVVSTRRLDASRQRVFDAYADPEKLVRWWGPAGFSMRVEEIDLRQGGHWRFTFRAPDGQEFENHLVFEALWRPDLFIAQHLSVPRYRGVVTFEDREGGTQVTMYWTFEDADMFARIRTTVEEGNEGNLDRLTAVVMEG